MEVLKEFLESSTIHGLAHISASKVIVSDTEKRSILVAKGQDSLLKLEIFVLYIAYIFG